MLDTFSCPGGRLQTGRPGDLAVLRPAGLAARPPDPAQVADAVARYQGYQALREFGARLDACLTSRPDASFELCDAILCADHAVTSLVPESGRGHGALYDVLAAGRIDQEAFAVLLTATLPLLAGGDEGRAWVAEHDQIDCGLLEAALAGWIQLLVRRELTSKYWLVCTIPVCSAKYGMLP